MKRYGKIAIVGLGNILLMDDGVGVHVVRRLEGFSMEGVVVAEVGTAVLGALDLLESVDVVVAVDAVKGGGEAGTVYLLDGSDNDTRENYSLHELGLFGALDLLPEDHRPRVVVVGVEPGRIDYGMELSPAVEGVVGKVADTVRSIAEKVRDFDGDGGFEFSECSLYRE